MNLLFVALVLFALGVLASLLWRRFSPAREEAEDVPAVPAEVMARAYAAFSHTLAETMPMEERIKVLVAVTGDRPDWEQQAAFLRTMALITFLSHSDDLDGMIAYASPGVALVDERLIRAASVTLLRTDSAGFERAALLTFASSSALESMMAAEKKQAEEEAKLRPRYTLKEYRPFQSARDSESAAPPTVVVEHDKPNRAEQ